MENYGYIRQRRGGPTIKVQKLALKDADCLNIRTEYEPDTEALDRMIMQMRPGRAFVVESLRVLSRRVSDVVDIIARITAKGGVLYSIQDDKQFSASPESADAAKAAHASISMGQIEAARARRGRGAGGHPTFFDKETAEGRKRIRDLNKLIPDLRRSNLTQAAIAEELGCSKATLSRELAAREQQEKGAEK